MSSRISGFVSNVLSHSSTIRVGRNLSTTRNSAAGEMLEVTNDLGQNLLTTAWLMDLPHCLTGDEKTSSGEMLKASSGGVNINQRVSAMIASGEATINLLMESRISFSKTAPSTGSGHGSTGWSLTA